MRSIGGLRRRANEVFLLPLAVIAPRTLVATAGAAVGKTIALVHRSHAAE